MKIRAITYFANPGVSLDPAVLAAAAQFAAAARPAFESAGFEVQTIRFATPPFPRILPDCRPETVIDFGRNLEKNILPLGFDYLAIGPALPDWPESYAAIPGLIAATENVFASGLMADPQTGISLAAVRACAEIIQALGPQDPNGFANLYFTALGNVPPGAPFFPAAYHADGPPAFALAMEAADLAVTAFTAATNLEEARLNLTHSLEENAQKLVAVAQTLTPRFGGIDYSLAPFPEVSRSLGTALERLGIPAVGLHGSLTASAFIANTIDRANFPRCGFSGMMLPVLEDATLADRAAQGTLSIKDLLLYSAVCGTGLDTIPLPGDTAADQLYPVLLDLAALSMRLDKPLTARLMPIPGKQAGDLTSFDFPFFANSRVMALDAVPLTGHLAADSAVHIRPRK